MDFISFKFGFFLSLCRSNFYHKLTFVMSQICPQLISILKKTQIKFDILQKACAQLNCYSLQSFDFLFILGQHLIVRTDPPLAAPLETIKPGCESKRIERVEKFFYFSSFFFEELASNIGYSWRCTGYTNTHSTYDGVKFLIIRKHFLFSFIQKRRIFLFMFFFFSSSPCCLFPTDVLDVLEQRQQR